MNTIEEAIFHAASELQGAQERTAFLERACGADPALRARIEALLEADSRARQFLADDPFGLGPDASPRPSQASAPPEETPGMLIGRYKLLQKIGEGGMGVVYMAEQQEPVRRRVALKIIKLGMDTKQVIARFEAERQALALMDHPNIAKVFDGGATDAGRPYFVMELVQGVPITEFCDRNQLTTEERIKLFIPVCQAIQSAHQKGIIHRDLKPANILVTLNPDGSGFPKVIDFGVAKATSQKLTVKTVFTSFAAMIGTPAYMSPEQAEMSPLDVDTRSDIYGLGVLLYELLTGTTPFPEKRLRSAGYNEMQRIIMQEEPERPSTRLSTLQGEQRRIVARNRGDTDLTLGRAFPSDLDWIIMKCLEKDRARRYETANGLAMDLQRHLQHEPVVARPPTALYRFERSVSRHKLAYGAAAAVILALVLGLGVATWMFIGERRAHDRAVAAEQEQSRLRAEAGKEKATAQEQLYDSLIGEARAARLARRAGYRDRVFGLLQRAKALDVPHRNLTDLRNEAVACLGDFIGLMPVTFTNSPSTLISGGHVVGSACLDPASKLAAFGLDDGTIQLSEMSSGKEVACFTGTNEVFQYLCFNGAGDQLHALSVSRGGGLNWAVSWPSIRLHSWGCQADGRWQQTADRALPGAGELFADGEDVYAIVRESSRDPPLVVHSITPGSPAEKSHLQIGDEIIGFAGVPVSIWDELNKLIQQRDGQATPIVVNRGGDRVELTVTPIMNSATMRSGIGVQYRHDVDLLTTLRLFNARIGAFVAGYTVTNSLPPGRFRFHYAFTPDRRLLAFGWLNSDDPSRSLVVNLYDWKTGQVINHLHLPREGNLILSADGKYLACEGGSRCEIYTVPGLERICQFKHDLGGQLAVFSGDVVALPMVQQHRVLLWNLANREDVACLDEPDWAAPACFSADGSLLLTVGDHHARLRRLNTPEKLELAAHTISVPGIAFNPDGTRLASVDKNRLLRVYDAVTGHIVWQTNDLPGPGQCVSYSPDGRWLVTGDWNTQLIGIWDAHTGQRLLELGTNRVGRTFSAQISPDGRYLAAVGPAGLGLAPETRIWAVEHGTPGQTNDSVTARLVKSFPGAGVSLMFAPDSHCFVFDGDSGLYMWKCSPSAELQLLPTDLLGSVQFASFTPDSRHLLVMGPNGEVLTVDLATGAQVSSFKVADPERDRGWLCLSPNGGLLAVRSDSGAGADIWDPKTGKLCYSLPEEAGTVYWLAWSPDSRRLAIARDNGNIAIWNLETIGQILAQLGLNP